MLEKSGVVSSTESKTAVEEFATFVVDVRARNLSSGSQSEAIADVISYILADYGFLARKSLCHFFKLCCLIIRRPLPQYPQLEINLNGCDVPSIVVKSCIRGIKSYVSTSHYQQGSFFTKHTMECVRSFRSHRISWYRLILILGVGYAVMVMPFSWNASKSCLKIILHVVRRGPIIACIVLIVQNLYCMLRTVMVLVLLEVVRALLRLLSLRLQLVLQVVLYLSSEVRLGSIAVWLPCLDERKSVKIVELVVPKGKWRNVVKRVRSLEEDPSNIMISWFCIRLTCIVVSLLFPFDVLL